MVHYCCVVGRIGFLVRYPFRTDCPSIIDNTDLICPHGGLLVDVAEESSLDENDRYM